MAPSEPLRCISAVVLTPVLYFALGFGMHLLGGAVDQPHPEYLEGNWFTHRVGSSAQYGVALAVVMAVLVLVDLAAQYARRRQGPVDLAYYPRPGGIRRCFAVVPARLTLVAGFLLLAGFFASTELELRAVEMGAGGWVWPPERVFFVCLVAWGVLWLADCLPRPGYGTVVAASGFLLLVLLCKDAYYGGMLRE